MLRRMAWTLNRFLRTNKYIIGAVLVIVLGLKYLHLINSSVNRTLHEHISSSDLTKYLFGDLETVFKPESGSIGLRTGNEGGELKCNQPRLDPYHPSVNKYFYKVLKLECTKDEDWVYIVNGSVFISQSVTTRKGKLKCDYIPIVRVDDVTNKDGDIIKNFSNGTSLVSDFFRVECRSQNGDKYSKVLAGIAYNKKLHERKSSDITKSNAMDLNILMFGFDSISRMTAIRKFVLTRKYLLNNLQGIELEGYNIVGDGTPQALIPILTGKTEEELPEARRGIKGAKPVDGHPFIWKEFKKAGYSTAWAEDSPKLGIFNHRMVGIDNQPTDHYLRPFYLSSEIRYEMWFKFVRNYLNSIFGFFSGGSLVDPAFCYGPRPKHQIFLDWLGDVFDMYQSKNKFVFGFHGEITHDNNNQIDYLDEDVRNFIKRLEIAGYLNKTLIILMSDHGARFEHFRQTVQGKLEERMPYFTFVFPSWFEQKYPEAYTNFIINSKRLSTPFDIHATFEHMLNYKTGERGDVDQRGISLFKEMPRARSCDHAGVEPHWCACLEWQDFDQSDANFNRVVVNAISTINGITEQYRNVCHYLRIRLITRAKKYFANSKVLSFKQSADHDGRVADLSSKTKNNEIFYQLTFVTEPGNGHFEITVRHIVNTDEIISRPKDISRTNKYGSDADCISQQVPHLERFCYCV